MASKPCTETVKDIWGKKIPCPGKPTESGCSNKAYHLGKYKTGPCGIGCHEGLNPKNYRGAPLPTCRAWQVCSCECHEVYDQMFIMAEQERQLVDHSTYVPEKNTFVMPDLAELAAQRRSSTDTPGTAPTRVESELPDAVPATIARSFAPTASGRAAKGELESQVKWACDVWMVEYQSEEARVLHRCTPTYVSEEIGKKFGIKNPSVGAIDAVWNRWVKIGFANIGRKPTRFLSYTEDGVRLTLEGCKERARRQKASAR